MSKEIELISDGDGIAVVGTKRDVTKFLKERGLMKISTAIDVHGKSVVQGAAAVIEGAVDVVESSGRWVKLTEESAKLVREFGLMDTKTPGIKHAMIGDPGAIGKWLQIDGRVGAILTNPAVLAGAAGVMAQVARQAEMKEIKAYLAQIDAKVSEVLRAQKDAELAKLAGARRSIDSAMKVRAAQGGHVDPTTWSTVQDRVGAVDDLISWALISLQRVADKVDAATSIRDRAKLATGLQQDVEELLAVIAHCFELQAALEVLRLDRVMEDSPGLANEQRLALEADRLGHRASIVEAAAHLLARLDEAAGAVNANVLLHAPSARKVTKVANRVAKEVGKALSALGADSGRDALRVPRWTDAIRDGEQLKNAGKDAGPKLIVPVLVVSGGVLFIAPQTRPFAMKALETAKNTLSKAP